VDWVLQKEEHYIPIEVKWTDTPTEKDARHLKVFLSEYPMATKGYILCQTPRMMKISEDILALPWQELPQLVNQLDQ
jgi:predicted AAA+ superfamily ATPase